MQIAMEEQQAISLVGLGILSLVLALTLRKYAALGKAAMNHAFWVTQALLLSAGAVMVLWPSAGFAAIVVAVIGGALLLRSLNRTLLQHHPVPSR
jgi:hypothetical protein